MIRLGRAPKIMTQLFTRHADRLVPLQIKRFKAAMPSKAGRCVPDTTPARR